MTPIMILLGVVAAIALYAIMTYNGLIRAVNRTKEAWADIEVQLKRRYDLIPNLVNTVKGAAAFESSTLEKVIQARNSAMQGGTLAQVGAAENELTGALKSIFALAESYPTLQSNQNYLELQRELADTEDKIQAARRFYNGNVRDLNTAIEVFPGNIFASMFKFSKMEFFELEESEKEAAQKPVEVKF
jgi:LemA protein